jgi:aspartate/methionine/tyrosine aminotransferase
MFNAPLSHDITERRLSRRVDTDVWEVHERALEMQRNGEDVILLSVGDPDFRTPEPIVDNAISSSARRPHALFARAW